MKKIVFILIAVFTIQIQAQDKATKVFFIRHAEVQNDGTDNPKLSEEGMQRAKKWSEVFHDEKLDKIYSTKLKRTQAVAWSVAHDKGLMNVIGYNPDDFNVDTFKVNNMGKNVLVVGHSNTIPAMINQLTGTTHLKDIDENDFGKLFIVTLYPGKPSTVTILNIN